ncbi:N-acetylneuraminate synthase family protein [Magnetococcales bacterium HHB-1]
MKKRELIIDGIRISDESECYVIAEIGHNHQGDMEQAKKLFLTAKEAGCHAVKLQKRENRVLYTKAMFNQPYDNVNSYGHSYGEHREALEFDRDQYLELQDYAREIGVTFFATAFDEPSADFLQALDMPAFKIASSDIIHTPLLKHIASFGKPMIISTGGATSEDIKRAYDTVMPINDQIAFLQCTSGYPASFEELNLRVIETLREEYPDTVIGLSAHDNGIAMALVGYVLGARIIEKHYTLNRALKGTDHCFSLEPTGMRKLSRDLKRAAFSLGNGVKEIYTSEKKPLKKMQKSIMAARALPKGHQLRMEDVTFKSPSEGLPPYRIDELIGRTLATDLDEEACILFEHLK